MEPRVVMPGEFPGSQWIDSFLSGRSQPLWIIELDDSNFGGTFAVDAGTGALVTGTAGRFFGNPLGGSYYGSVAFSTAKNLAVSEELFQTNGSIVGRLGSVGVVVPDVLIANPGSTSSVQLNYTTFISHNPPNVTLLVVNPLSGYQNSSSDGSPPGISFQFLRPTLSLVSNSSAYATLSISVDRNAPSGTYLIEVDATYPSTDLEGRIQLFFFLSIWDGLGQWPPPPMVK